MNKDERRLLLKKYTSHFIWKVLCVWEGVEDRTELQYIDPHSYGHQRWVFLVLQGCSAGDLGAHSAGCSFLYRILSPTGLVSKLTDFLSSPSYIIVQSPTQSLEWHVWSSCSSRVTLFRCISLWLYRGILPCPIMSAKLAHANGICTSAVFGMACLAGLKVNILHLHVHYY